MLSEMGISGSKPACRAPGISACALIFGLALAFAWPVAGEVDEENSVPAASQAGSDREAPAKEVRPALARRKRNALNQFQFDPKVFEARGRELQGEYYEITSLAKANPTWSKTPAKAEASNAGEAASSPPKDAGSKHWMIWSGAAGLAALVGGTAGYLLLEKHTAPAPVSVHLDDNPDNP